MLGKNFFYDGKFLSDFGFMVCNFKENDFPYISNNSTKDFNFIQNSSGNKGVLVSSKYSEFLTDSFFVCKIDCDTNKALPLENDEVIRMTRWLSSGKVAKFKPVLDWFENIHFLGVFNVGLVYHNLNVIGFELSFFSSMPFAIYDDLIFKNDIKFENQSFYINDISDEIGFLKADVKLTCTTNGDISITNKLNNEITTIKSCIVGEVVEIKYPTIKSSLRENITNDFNFKFVKIGNDGLKRTNEFVFSNPCKIEIKYNPIRKVGL